MFLLNWNYINHLNQYWIRKKNHVFKRGKNDVEIIYVKFKIALSLL